MQLVRPPYRLMLLGTSAVVVICVVASALIKVPIMVAASGVMLHANATLESTVSAQHEGLIAALRVKVGDVIAPGDVIASLAQPGLEQDLLLARDEETAAVSRLQSVRALQKASIETLEPLHALQAKEAEESIGRLTERETELARLASDQTGLRASGTISIDRYLQVRAQLAEARESIAARKAALLSLRVEWAERTNQFAREIVELEDRVAQAGRQVQRLTAQLAAASVIRATQGGMVTEVKAGPGDLVRFNSPVVGLTPDSTSIGDDSPNSLIALAFVPLDQGKRVVAGMRSFVDPASVRRDVYGEILGRVVSVSQTPATPELLRNLLRNDDLVRKASEGGPAFLATIELERTSSTPSGYVWTSSKGPDFKLTAGTSLRAEVETEEVSLLGLIVPALRQMLRGDTTR
jgi:HlyD family secretion protein